MRSSRLYVVFILLLLQLPAMAQRDKIIDSLKNVLLATESDTQKVSLLYQLARYHRKRDKETAFKYLNEGLAVSAKAGHGKGTREGILLSGVIHGLHGEYDKAFERYFELEKLCIAAGDSATLGDCYQNIGSVHYYKGDYSEALESYIKALRIFESIKYKEGVLRCYNNIANVYYFQENYPKSLEFYNKTLEGRKEMRDSLGMATSLDNIALVYNRTGQNDKALDYQLKALSIFERLKYPKELATSLNNIGLSYMERGQYEKALEHFERSLAIRKELNDPKGTASCLVNIGETYRFKGDRDRAFKFVEEGRKIALEIGAKQILADAYQTMALLYEQSNDHRNAYKYIRMHHAIRDSLLNEETASRIAEAEARYETEKKEAEIALLRKDSQLLKQEAEIRELETNRMILGLALGLILLVIIAVFIYLGLRQKRAANLALKKQNEEIRHQKQEITDSINYARRIQESILPPAKYIKDRLPDSFILYKPKDIVSGDFYWVEKAEGHVLFAAVDCTGHGVPGALMSVVGLNLLNQAVHEKQLTKPSDILSFLDEGVNNTLRQSGGSESVKDGMDLALCSLDTSLGRLQYAGAYNSLYIVQDNELREIKADKFPIGVNIDGKADTYTNHEIPVKKGDCVYLFSDGYADQFGGPKGKKFKYNALRKLLLEIHRKSMDEQQAILDRTIEEWKGSLEQWMIY
jgi:serine phosphatase RsbU (regulator of sigma subunit)